MGKPEEKRPLGRPRPRWLDGIRTLVIKYFKLFYRQLILKRLISMLDECGDRV
jgi:hypothetical protein